MIKAVIVDDEPKAIELLEDYCKRSLSVTVDQTFRDPIRALASINAAPPELVLLDIDMPGLSGISLASLIPEQVVVIFTTAYSEYAVQSYDLKAKDYLLKPISFERFMQAIQRVRTEQAPLVKEEHPAAPAFLTLKSGFDLFRIPIDSIYFLEKDGNYMTYHTPNKKIVVRESIAQAMEKLPADFIQVHKSFIVSTRKITLLQKVGIRMLDRTIPVGSAYKKTLLDLL